MISSGRCRSGHGIPKPFILVFAALVIATGWFECRLQAQATPPGAAAPATPPAQAAQPVRVTCSSRPGEREQCAANTANGVVLASSTGEAACLLGRTWGYDEKGVWVSDGCSAEFVVAAGAVAGTQEKQRPLSYVPNAGFLLFDGEMGQIYFRLFSYARYVNQRSLDSSYVDSFGVPHDIQLRQDMQLAKFFAPFSGWFLTPKFRYYLYVWSSNASQGDPAQVVGAGNLSYNFNRFVNVGAGITSLPAVRSTEGQFPYWLGVDDRLIADEFFRGSYTTGAWLKGEIATKFKYMAMIANNLSTLGVSAAQLDNKFNTQSYMLQWLPTTGEFGLYGTFGDFDMHDQVATRFGVHYTFSTEEKQSQPNTNGIENSQIRLTDGSIIFTPDLFAPGVTVNTVDYNMVSVDAGIKHKGRSLEAEFYWRHLNDFTGINTGGLAPMDDYGYQLQSSAMFVPRTLQGYISGSQIFGTHGDPWEVRAGANWYFMKERGLRLNGEWIYVRESPVGYTAYPMPVGANGPLFHINLEMNF
ncbi:MAG TPA: DUF3011 domain-containing protein [Vicinamibacterales bacterium]|nr:DUF3011 domain-containing protein [Vicinamibacterales bacterium]